MFLISVILFTQKNAKKVLKIKLDLEKLFLAAFLAVFLLIGSGYLFDNRIKHDFPYAYLASDAFQHQVRAESIKDAGNYKNEASYIVMGIKNVIGYYPPLLYNLSVILSYLSGLEVYDTIYLLVFLMAASASLLMYFVIRHFSKNVAIISLPFSFLVFSGGLYSGFTWGHWPAIVSQLFLIGVFWYTSKMDLEKSWVFIGLFLGAAIMTHTSEALFALIYLFLFFILITITKKLKFAVIKNIFLGGIIAFLITSYYLVIFKYVWLESQTGGFGVMRRWDNPTIYLSDFGLLLFFMAVGALMSLLFIRKNFIPALASLTMLIIGLGNYFGFREKAFQLRFFWPVLLSFLIGFGIYNLLKLLIKDWKQVYSIGIAVLLGAIIVLGFAPFMPQYQKIQTNGLMDPYHWDVFKWLAKNTGKDEKIYFFYGDIYGQDALLRNSKRTHYQVVPEDVVDAINKREIRKSYDSEMPGDSGTSAPYRKSFFSFGFALQEIPREQFIGKKDICSFEYIVFDKVSMKPALAQYSLIVASELLKKDYMSKIFENEIAVVLKNNNVGADCIEQRNF